MNSSTNKSEQSLFRVLDPKNIQENQLTFPELQTQNTSTNTPPNSGVTLQHHTQSMTSKKRYRGNNTALRHSIANKKVATNLAKLFGVGVGVGTLKGFRLYHQKKRRRQRKKTHKKETHKKERQRSKLY